MPDLRGLFLRGQGGNSSDLGLKQGDAIRKISGTIISWVSQGNFRTSATGAFRIGEKAYGVCDTNVAKYWNAEYIFDSSLQVPVADENRPVNMAVRYLIRALP